MLWWYILSEQQEKPYSYWDEGGFRPLWWYILSVICSLWWGKMSVVVVYFVGE